MGRSLRLQTDVQESLGRSKGKRGFAQNQESRSAQNPTHFLSGSMNCAACGVPTITQVSGKGGGFYGYLRV